RKPFGLGLSIPHLWRGKLRLVDRACCAPRHCTKHSQIGADRGERAIQKARFYRLADCSIDAAFLARLYEPGNVMRLNVLIHDAERRSYRPPAGLLCLPKPFGAGRALSHLPPSCRVSE